MSPDLHCAQPHYPPFEEPPAMETHSRMHQLEHPALLYGSLDSFVDTMAHYVSDGVANDEAVFVAARGDYLSPLKEAVGKDADRAGWADTFDWHPHPARRLHAFHELVTERLEDGVKRIRLAGEPVWPDGPPELVLEWQRYESVLNTVLAPYPVTLMCLYDATRLDPTLLQSACVTHRAIRRDAYDSRSPVFEDPADLLRRWTYPREAPPPGASSRALSDASGGRRFLEEHALQAGLDEERTMELCLAANEILTNAFVHAGGGTIHAWTDHDRFVCQVDDEGPGIGDPLAGYRPPAEDREGGRGIWIARQLVDLLHISPSASGTSVRMFMHRDAA